MKLSETPLVTSAQLNSSLLLVQGGVSSHISFANLVASIPTVNFITAATNTLIVSSPDNFLVEQSGIAHKVSFSNLIASIPKVLPTSDTIAVTTFTGTISGVILATSVAPTSPLKVGDVIYGAGVTLGTTITDISNAAFNTYTVSVSQTVGTPTSNEIPMGVKGVVSLTNDISFVSAIAISSIFDFPAPVDGETKNIICNNVTGLSPSVVINITSGKGVSTITLNSIGAAVKLIGIGAFWYIESSHNVVIA